MVDVPKTKKLSKPRALMIPLTCSAEIWKTGHGINICTGEEDIAFYPEDARRLANWLLRAADWIEKNNK